MKTLLTLFLLVSLSAFAQQDTLQLQHQFFKQYELASKNAPQLTDVKACIETAEALYQNKQDKTKLSMYLGVLHNIVATKFDAHKKATTGFKSRGVVSEAEKAEAINKASKYYSYFLEHYKEKDDTYRAAQNALALLK